MGLVFRVLFRRFWYSDRVVFIADEGTQFHKLSVMGNLKKNGFFYIFPNVIKIKKFQEQLIILKGDYDGHFFAQRYFGSQSLHRKKIFQFFVPKRSGV